MPHPGFDKLPVNLDNVASNTACSTKAAVNYGRIYYAGRGGTLFPPVEIDLGPTIPDIEEPSEVVNWLHTQVEARSYRRFQYIEKQIVAFALEKLCESKSHGDSPGSRYLSARLERRRGMFVARTAARPFQVLDSSELLNERDGIGQVQNIIPGSAKISRVIDLPANNDGNHHPITHVVGLYDTFDATHGALRTSEDGFLDEIVHHDRIWPAPKG